MRTYRSMGGARSARWGRRGGRGQPGVLLPPGEAQFHEVGARAPAWLELEPFALR